MESSSDWLAGLRIAASLDDVFLPGFQKACPYLVNQSRLACPLEAKGK